MSTVMEPIPEHDSKQASQAETTEQEIEEMEPGELIRFIQQKKPKLLTGDRLAEFKNAGIFGESFLSHANDVGWFQNTCKLSPGLSDMLVNLARGLIGRAMPYTPRRQQANNVTGNRQQVVDVEMSGAADSAGKSTDHASEFAEAGGEARRLQANNVTGNRQQAEDVEMFDFNAKIVLRIMELINRETAGMKSKLLSFMPCTRRRQ